MIIQIAGTSGSGKSHLVRELMRLSSSEPHEGDGERILGYNLKLKGVKAGIYVVGSYAVPTGGCDTIKKISEIYEVLQDRFDQGQHVVFEGLFAMNHTRGMQFVAQPEIGRKYCVLLLTTPLGVCFKSINARRAERGEDQLENQENTKGNYGRAISFASHMRDAGAQLKKVSRESALPTLLELLCNG